MKSLVNNCDINAVSVFVLARVMDKKVSSVEWNVGAEFWRFLFFDQVFKSYQTDSPSRTLIRLAFKSQQMGFPFTEDHLTLEQGEVFESHKRKHDEMLNKQQEYPYQHYRLKVKSKKSYIFTKAYAECSCGRKANINCTFQKCKRCCQSEIRACKTHKIKKPLIAQRVDTS